MRPIDQRFYPKVAGIDLAQSLNFIEADRVGRDFMYDDYTSFMLKYVPGSRPLLEAVATPLRVECDPMATVERIADYICREHPWAGFYEKETGEKLSTERGLNEEELLESGYGWCNEQARVFCVLSQILHIPSRLIFASNNAGNYGHVTMEVHIEGQGWMLVDQSFGYLFRIEGRPVCAYDVYHDTEMRAHFEPIYLKMCRDLITELGVDIATDSFRMCTAENPLDGFTDIGFINHYTVR